MSTGSLNIEDLEDLVKDQIHDRQEGKLSTENVDKVRLVKIKSSGLNAASLTLYVTFKLKLNETSCIHKLYYLNLTIKLI